MYASANKGDVVSLSEEYVGKEFSKEIALKIEKAGYSYSVSCRDGTIARIIKPVYPSR